LEYLTLEVGDYEIDVIPLHEMPGLKVLRLLTTAPDMKRLKHSVDMLRLALRNPQDWETKIQYFTMGQLMAVVDDWMNESQAMAARKSEEDDYYRDEEISDEDMELISDHLQAEQERLALLESSQEQFDFDEDDDEEYEYEPELSELDPNALFELFMSELEKDEDEDDKD